MPQYEANQRRERQARQVEDRQAAELLRARQERLKKLREEALAEIAECLQQEFLGADDLWEAAYSDVVTKEELQSLKGDLVQDWFHQNAGADDQPDREQAAAIAETKANVQVVARAGSGKTRTIVNRAYFLVNHCQVPASEVLLLAFNRKAAEEWSAGWKRWRTVLQSPKP